MPGFLGQRGFFYRRMTKTIKNIKLILFNFDVLIIFSFQLPAILTQMSSSQVSSSPVPSAPAIPVVNVAPAIPAVPSIPVVNVAAPAAGPPAISVIPEVDEDPDVQSFAIPFSSTSSVNFIPKISTEDSWMTELEFR